MYLKRRSKKPAEAKREHLDVRIDMKDLGMASETGTHYLDVRFNVKDLDMATRIVPDVRHLWLAMCRLFGNAAGMLRLDANLDMRITQLEYLSGYRPQEELDAIMAKGQATMARQKAASEAFHRIADDIEKELEEEKKARAAAEGRHT